MMIHSLKTTQFLPISPEEAWSFFSSPENLKEITPEYMRFKILTPLPEKMYPGMILAYKLNPLPFMRLTWVTEITQVKEPEYFVDTQLSGPYSIWHHEHHFKKTEGGVEMTDLLYYKLPMGFLGEWLNYLYIRKKVEMIFSYRKRILDEKFSLIKSR
ncbi:MAG: SRPBCC family protein [Bacteroidales bacterium]|nr:SRPBCC family protein [Bacteroidales bacterium]